MALTVKEKRRQERERRSKHAAKVRAQRRNSTTRIAPATPEADPDELLEWLYEYLPEHFYGDAAEFHREIAELLKTTDRAALAAPRGHNKSTLLSLGYALFRAAKGHSRYVVIISDSSAQAADHVGNIFKELLENDKLLAAYPHLALPDPEHYKQKKVKRVASDFITVGGVRFTGKGAGMGLRGMRYGNRRPDLILVDDLENDDNVRTPEQREKLKSWFLKSVSNLFGASGGQLVVVGTILHRKSLLAWLLSGEGPGRYVKRLYRAIKEDGTPLWPGAWDKEKLEQKRLEIGSRAFSSEFLNEPVDEGSTLWKEAWISANRRDVHPELKRLAVAVDPSASGNGDTCGIVAGGFGEDGHGYTLEDNTLRGSPATWARVAVDTYNRLEADFIVAEKNQGGEMIEQTIRSVLREGEAMPRVVLVHASRGKAVRADPIATLDEQGKLHIVGKLPELEEELVSWVPGLASPGRMDAYVWLWSQLMLEPSPEPYKSRKAASRRGGRR